VGPLRLVLQRAAASWPLLCAAFVTVLVAATLIAAIPIYSEAVARSGLERSLEQAPVTATSLEVSGYVDAADYAAADRDVTRAVERALEPTGGEIFRSGRSDSFALPSFPEGSLALVGFFEGIEEHARLAEGDWPTGPGSAALSQPAARLLEVSAGDTLTLRSQTGAEEQPDVEVSGVYRIDSVDDPFWRADPLELEGVARGDFTTYGPLVVTRSAFPDFASGPTQVRWRIAPRFDRLAVDEVAELRAGVEGLEAALAPEGAGPESLEVEGGLAGILTEAERSLTVARSGVLVPSLQLAILAAYALLFTAFLMAEERRLETVLLQARGADSRRVALVALVEGLLVALPAALAGPWLAALSLRLLNRFGPLAEIDLSLDPHVGREAYVLAAVAAVASVAALVVPALRSQRVALAVAQLGRPPEKGFVERARLDLVLLVLALLAYWQLRRYGGTLIEDAQGTLGIDPFLIAAPALGLLAGAVLALRVVPAVALLAERLGSSARGVVPPLGTRQLSRRPRTYARAALLLTLALAIGLFAAAFGSTWTRSQQDQADHEAGADVRVKPDERSGALPRLALPRAYEDLPGVQAVAPGLTEGFDLPGAAAGALVAIDAERAPEVVSLREDLADEPTDELFRPLAARRTELPALRLPRGTRELALTVRGDLDPRAQRFGFFGAVPGLGNVGVFPPTLALVVRDEAGVLHWYRAGELTKPDQRRRVVVDLAGAGAQGENVEPAYPLELVSIELGVVAPFLVPNEGELEVLALGARSEGGAWAPLDLEAPEWSVLEPQLAGAQTAPDGQISETPRAPLVLRLTTGSSDQDEVEVAFRLLPGKSRVVAPVPALVTEPFLEATGSRTGEVVPLELAGARRPVEIVNVLEGFPTVPADDAALVVDYRSYSALSYLAEGTIVQPDEWWIDAAAGRAAPVATRLAAPPFSSAEVESRQVLARTLQNDPVALGTIGALSLGFLAAAVFAAVGFAVSAAVSARQRTTEFAVMRSLGLSSRQLSGWLVVENGVLVLVSLACGTLLGLLLARFVLPTVSLTQSGEETFPSPIVEIPWGTVAALELGLLAVLALIIVIEVRVLRRIRVAATLRASEVR
jgi:FtsX-like permease family